MDLPKVEGTQVRGKIYHLNLRIKPEIQDFYGGKSHLRGSLRTSDPKVAAREVRKRKAELLAKEQERARQAEVDDIVSQLTPEQRRAYDAAGGLEGLLEEFERAHSDSPAPDEGPLTDEVRDIEPVAAVSAAPLPANDEVDTVSAETDGTAMQGVSTALTTVDVSDELFTLSDLLAIYIAENEAEGTEQFSQCIRLFMDYNGEVPFEALDVDHLHEFAVAAKGLPADMTARLGDGTLVGEMSFTEMVAWANQTQARHISETTRFQYVAMLKELMDFGVPRFRRGDPWSDYRLQIVKREPREKPEEAPKKMFTSSGWRGNGLLVRVGEIAILAFVVVVMLLLWLG